MTFQITDCWGFSYAMRAERVDSVQCWVIEPEFGYIWEMLGISGEVGI